MSELDVQHADPNIVIAKEANPWLVGLGIFLVVLFVAGVVYARAVGSETRETSPPTREAASATEGSEPETATAAKVTKTKSAPSETLLTAILASGGVLILVGVLYARISSIKLPGGAEIGLSSKEKEDTAKKVAEVLPDDATPEKAAEVTLAATDKVKQAKAYGAIDVPEETIGEIVEQVSPDPV